MADQGFGLALQSLPSDTARVLVAGEVASLRNGDFRFSTTDVNALLEGFHIPQPSNTSARLGHLRSRKLAIRNRDGSWSLTPQGRLKAQQTIGNVDFTKLEPKLAAATGAELGQVRHSTIPPVLAPLKWNEPIGRLLESHPFETNVFLMTRYPSAESDPLRRVIGEIGDALAQHGLTLHRADDRQLDDDLLGNVAAYMWACQYGIGLIENRAGGGLNYNVVIELGGMLMTGRRCAFLKDTTPDLKLPTDFVGQIYKEVNFEDRVAVSAAVHNWVAFDLSLGTCESCSAL